MATTTMGSTPRTGKNVNPAVYWGIGALVLLALIIFYSMATRTTDNATPTTSAPVTTDISDTSAARTTTPAGTPTTDVNATAPMERTPASAPADVKEGRALPESRNMNEQPIPGTTGEIPR